MKQETNNIKFEKHHSTLFNSNKLKNNFNNSQNKRENAKNNLIKKYNLSEEKAEKLLKQIENRKLNNSFSYNNSLNSKKIKGSQQKQQDQQIKEQPDVDTLLKDIIPDYEKKISIEFENVDLSFEVTTEKIDTIKEQFIRTLKRNKNKKRKLHVLNNISFQIYQGEKVGIIGYNGAGKSTLLNVITGIYIPDKGNVKTYGKISPLLSLGAGFDFNYTGRENILLNGAVLGYEKEFLLNKIDEIIEFSELGEFIDIPIKNYSSGMLAKLGFSIATIVEPDILIIDEILGVGDVNFQKKSHDKIKSIMDGKTTVLLVSHSIPQIRELCDKAIWINNGKIKEIGEVNKVCDNYLRDAEKATKSQLNNIKFN